MMRGRMAYDDRPLLLSPVRLGAHELRNRVVMAPMTRNRAGEGNVPTPSVARYYGQRAGAGLIVTEATQVTPQGQGYPFTPGIHSSEQAQGWKRVTDEVHRRGGLIFLQLWHVGRISHPSVQPGGALPVAPSAIRPEGEIMTLGGPRPFVTPRALELGEIPGVVERFAEGAALARLAGFDGVEVHGANGYLLDQFLRDGSNHRTDAYGGGIASRARLLMEVTEAVAGVWGAERVGVRLSPLGAFNSMSDSDPAATFGHAARELGRLGLAYLHVVELVAQRRTAGAAGDRLTPALAEAFGGPVIANGGYDLERAEAAVRSGEAAAVSFGVPFISNPDLVRRFERGAELVPGDRATFYGGGDAGYTDYPALDDADAGEREMAAD
jgi:N-ethylmaleimide reductase